MKNLQVRQGDVFLESVKSIPVGATHADETSLINFIKERIEESKTAGIVSYLASPLDVKEQYRLATGRETETTMRNSIGLPITIPAAHYVYWLEKEVIRLKGSLTNDSSSATLS